MMSQRIKSKISIKLISISIKKSVYQLKNINIYVISHVFFSALFFFYNLVKWHYLISKARDREILCYNVNNNKN